MFFVYLVLSVLSSAWAHSSYSGHVDSLFQSDELPSRKVIYFSGADSSGYNMPIHFGGVGTFAYESFLISGHNIFFDEGSFGIFDCFCAGDQFRLYITNTLIGVTTTLDTTSDPAPLDCGVYNEDQNICFNSSSYGFARYTFLLSPNQQGPYNVTIEVTQSPYGGGIAYFFIAVRSNLPP